MWLLAKPFQNDIRVWVSARIAEKIEALEQKQASYGPRIQQRTKDKDTRDLERSHSRDGSRSQKLPIRNR
jgi:DNA helicase-2/ATP-dependent DNA helicase PcrA